MNKIIKKEIKIELLDWQTEQPFENIEGLCVNGNINVDGNSSVRRTCSLTLSAKSFEDFSADWGISKKIKIYIRDNENKWINQGVYIITSLSMSKSVSGVTISISGQDKMCLLNGTIGGAIFAETDFGNINTYTTEPIYTLLDNEPADWKTNYKDYYTYTTDGIKIAVSGITPSFSVGLYFEKDEASGSFTVLESEPIDWVTNYNKYYEEKDGIKVLITETAPLFKKNTYYIGSKKALQELTIFEIIQEAVHSFGGEKYENIIIKDIEDGLELLQYQGNEVLVYDNGSLVESSSIKGLSVFKEIFPYGLYIKNADDEYEPAYEFKENTTYYMCTEFEENGQMIYKYNIANGIFGKPEYEKLLTKPADWEENYNNYYYEIEGVIQQLDFDTAPPFLEEVNYYQKVYNNAIKIFNGFMKESYQHYQRTYGAVYIKENNVYTVAFETPKQKIYYFDKSSGKQFYQYGDTVGYRFSPLTYSEKDFILNPGDNVVTLLDKIKSKFGIYEYFYDEEGRFVFQKKQTYINLGLYPNESVESQAQYADEELIVSANVNPQITNIKNDFSIWGTTADKLPFHLRVGVTAKPTEYISYTGKSYTTAIPKDNEETVERVWEDEKNRITSASEAQWLFSSESKDIYYGVTKNGQDDRETIYKFTATTASELVKDESTGIESWKTIINSSSISILLRYGIALSLADLGDADTLMKYYKKKTEKYSVDYRELIYQMALDYFAYHTEPDFELIISSRNPWAKNGKTGYESFYTDMKEFWPKLYNSNIDVNEEEDYIMSGSDIGWNKSILNPSSLFFWFELIDGNPKYQIQNIGSRLKAEKNENISAITYPETPKCLFYAANPEEAPEGWRSSFQGLGNFPTYTLIQIPNDKLNDFTISPKHYSALELMEGYLYSYQSLGESETIPIIPDYSLKPNTIIEILGQKYLIKKISYSLAYNGTMNLELTKIYENVQGE